MRQPGEPSVEDILESIKQVMARDNRSTAVGERKPKRDALSYAWDAGSIIPSQPDAGAQEAVDEAAPPLGRFGTESAVAVGAEEAELAEGTETAADISAEPQEHGGTVLDLDAGEFDPHAELRAQIEAPESTDLQSEPEQEASMASVTSNPEFKNAAAGPEGAVQPLVTERVQTSMRESLATLASLTNVGVAQGPAGVSGKSIDNMVRELLRPMLSDWLDRNLPPLVERMVAEEIARIVGKQL